MVPDVDWLFPEPSAKLGNIGYGNVVQGPKGIFIESCVTLDKADFYAVGQEIVLPY